MLGVTFDFRGGGGSFPLASAPAECVILRRETPKDPVTLYSAGSGACPGLVPGPPPSPH